jgi:hypothetical protein
MRLSDFQKPQTQQRNLAAEAICDANATKILGGQVDCSKIPMKICELARGSNDPFKQASRQIAHDALDRAIDKGAFSHLEEEDEPEEEEEEETEKVKRQPRSRTARSSSYATDAEFISKHLDRNMLCSEAERKLYDRAYEEQVKNPNRSYWCGLLHFLSNQPKGSRIRDIKNKVGLSALINKTLAA